MKIVQLDKKDYNTYEVFLLSNSQNLLYASIKYKFFLEEILDCKSEYWLVKDKNNNIKGVLPLMYKDGKLGRIYNSLPFYGSNGGIITQDKEVAELLVEKYNSIISNVDVAAANFVENPLCDIKPKEILSNETDIRIGQFTPLDIQVEESAEDSLMATFHYKTRNMIRKAIKSGIKTSVRNTEFEFLEYTHQENMEAIGGKAKSHAFFSALKKIFIPDQDYRIYIAEKEGEMIGALLLFYYNKTIEYFTPVIKSEFRSLQPMSILIYNAMVDGMKRGYTHWNWGGTWSSQEGVYRFKNRWNTKNIEYKYFIQINNEAIYNSTKEELLNEYYNFYVLPFSSLTCKN